MSGDIFGYGWREDHAREGDHALQTASKAMEVFAASGGMPASEMTARMANIQALAALAQAHYAATNVRTRPIRDVDLPAPQAGTGWVR